ncbi:MAG: threonine synthase [Spirochaetaceae bacterium]|jgi:threonine synthase|nr:threonine synthase [Spirochaetaceae bacterium]
MRFSTTGAKNGNTVSFKEAVFHCLPQTGGLYIPAIMPDIRAAMYPMDEKAGYNELVAPVTGALLEDEMDEAGARRVAASCAGIAPELEILDERFSILHLTNGPTGTFKDFSAAFLGAVLNELLRPEEHLLVLSQAVQALGASISGAFAPYPNITTVLLYPEGSIYGLNEDAFRRPGSAGNIIPVRIAGSLDDCNRLINEILLDEQWTRRYSTTSATAINPARLIPQAFFYVYAFIKLKKTLSQDLFFSVPSGNFGNLIAGLYAWKFGLPVNGFIAAMNINNALGDLWKRRNLYPNAPDYKAPPRSRPAVTLSPALDVHYPANHELLLALYDEVPAVMRNMVFPQVITDEETEKSMEFAWKRYNVILDPHSAVAFMAALKHAGRRDFDGHIVTLATGHPARYPALLERVTGQKIDIPPRIALLQKKSEPLADIPCELDMLESVIASCF